MPTPLQTTNYNLLTTTRWIAFLPVQTIDSSYNSTNIAFNLTQVNLNQLSIDSNDFSALGYNVAMPSNVRNQDKTITFSYIPDSELSQYKFLYHWFSKIAVEDGAGLSTEVNSFYDYAVPIKLLLLSEYKNPIMEITFTDAWIQSIGELNLNYQDDNSSPVTHNFTIKYTNMKFNDEPKF